MRIQVFDNPSEVPAPATEGCRDNNHLNDLALVHQILELRGTNLFLLEFVDN